MDDASYSFLQHIEIPLCPLPHHWGQRTPLTAFDAGEPAAEAIRDCRKRVAQGYFFQLPQGRALIDAALKSHD